MSRAIHWLSRVPGLGTGLVVVVFVLLWWWASSTALVPRAYLPSPSEVWTGFIDILTTPTYLEHVRDSLLRLLVHYLVASAAGITVGIAMGIIPSVGRFVRPLLGLFNSVAGIAWLPLAMLWFGIGEPTVAFVTMNGVFFVVAINALGGVQSVPRTYEQALAVLGAGKWEIIRSVLLPGALPSILNGLRLAMGFGWRALVASEMLAAATGLGYLVYRGSYDFRYDLVWAGIFLIGIISVGLERLFLVPVQRWTVQRWGMLHEHR